MLNNVAADSKIWILSLKRFTAGGHDAFYFSGGVESVVPNVFSAAASRFGAFFSLVNFLVPFLYFL
jgi:hypothetical protein